MTDIEKRLFQIVYNQTQDSKFARDMCIVLETDSQKQQMIEFIKDNNPSLNDINYQSFLITS